MIRNVSDENLPRVRQLHTACSLRPVSLESSPLPPRASMTESTVVSACIGDDLHEACNPSSGHRALIDRWAAAHQDAHMAATLYSPTHPKAVGARLRRFREAMGMTGTRFAAAAGMTVQALKNYESGLRRPNPEQMYKMKMSFGLTSDYLLFGNSDGLPPDKRELVAKKEPVEKKRRG